MTEENSIKTNYNEAQDNRGYENQYEEPAYMPTQYDNRGYTDSFYEEYEDSGAGSFLLGAIVGGVIGAATALFLAPKTGKEMRNDLSTQAVHLKDKGVEIGAVAKDKAAELTSVAKDKAGEYTAVAKDKAGEYTAVAKDKAGELTTVAKDKAGELTSVAKDKAGELKSAAKDKATELTSVAKEKTDELTAVAKEKKDVVTKSLQEQSGQLVEKVKSMRSKNSIPMDDGTAYTEGDEATDFIKRSVTEVEEDLTATGEAMKEAVVGNEKN